MKDERKPAGECIFLDNMPFTYEPLTGSFLSRSLACEESLKLEEVRRRNMVMSHWEVATVDGVPFLYNGDRDTFYRLGNSQVQMTGEEVERKERQGLVAYPWGDAFRKIVQQERVWAERQRDEDMDR